MKKSKNLTISRLELDKKAKEFIFSESGACLPFETGGILIGREGADSIFITRALGPGPNALHDVNGFKRDGQYSQEELERIFELTQGEEDYVGEWHSHPAPCDASSIDIGSIAWISQKSDYNCKSPVLLISILSISGPWELVGYIWTSNQLKASPIKIF